MNQSSRYSLISTLVLFLLSSTYIYHVNCNQSSSNLSKHQSLHFTERQKELLKELGTINFTGVKIESPARVPFVPLASEPTLVEICPGVYADNSGVSSASVQIQYCINALRAGGILSLPSGAYLFTTGISITQNSITINTLGLSRTSTACMFLDQYVCATFVADPNLYSNGGMMVVSGAMFFLDHIVLNGNRFARLNSAAAYDCTHTADRATGPNSFVDSVGSSITNSISELALCGSGFPYGGDYSIVFGNMFAGNGDHEKCVSDGLTVGPSVSLNIGYNLFQDNSDVNLILFGGTDNVVLNNQIRMTGVGYQSFAGFMMDNMGIGTGSLGNFTNTMVMNNDINCNVNNNPRYYGCDFGMEIGPYAWYTTSKGGGPLNHIYGGTVTQNVVAGARQGINMAGAGYTYAPVNVDSSNVVLSYQPSPGHPFTNSFPGVGCDRYIYHATSAYNADPGTVVNFAAKQPQWTFNPWELCV